MFVHFQLLNLRTLKKEKKFAARFTLKGMLLGNSLRKDWSCRRLIFKSGSLNWYGMFHPNGPYLMRSCTAAWKKARPKTILRHTFPLSPANAKNLGSDIGKDW
jgi:hypothetical protein